MLFYNHCINQLHQEQDKEISLFIYSLLEKRTFKVKVLLSVFESCVIYIVFRHSGVLLNIPAKNMQP